LKINSNIENDKLLSDSEIQIVNDSIITDTTHFIKGFFKDHLALWKSPLKMNAKKYLFWAPVFVATGICFSNDERIHSSFMDYQSKHSWVGNVSPVITNGGDTRVVLGAALAFYGAGALFNNTKAKQTGVMAFQALGHAVIFVTAGKIITGRERPSFNNGISTWHWFPASLKQFGSEPQPKYNSFPSGHTIAIWSVATVIAKQYRKTVIVPILAYGIVTGVGLSRVFEDAHWLSDVIVGAAMGYTIGSFVVKIHKNTRWMLFPASNGKNLMIAGMYRL
jgi:membrane-associated phospholipid phosphatase